MVVRAVETGAGKGPARTPKAGPQPLSVAEASVGLVAFDLTVRETDVVFVKSIVEASEGLAVLLAERGGEIRLASPCDRADELAELVDDLVTELRGYARPATEGG